MMTDTDVKNMAYGIFMAQKESGVPTREVLDNPSFMHLTQPDKVRVLEALQSYWGDKPSLVDMKDVAHSSIAGGLRGAVGGSSVLGTYALHDYLSKLNARNDFIHESIMPALEQIGGDPHTGVHIPGFGSLMGDASEDAIQEAAARRHPTLFGGMAQVFHDTRALKGSRMQALKNALANGRGMLPSILVGGGAIAGALTGALHSVAEQEHDSDLHNAINTAVKTKDPNMRSSKLYQIAFGNPYGLEGRRSISRAFEDSPAYNLHHVTSDPTIRTLTDMMVVSPALQRTVEDFDELREKRSSISTPLEDKLLKKARELRDLKNVNP